MNNSTSTVPGKDIAAEVKPEGATVMERLVGMMLFAAGCGAFGYLGGNIGMALGTSLLTTGFLLISGKMKGQPKEQPSS